MLYVGGMPPEAEGGRGGGREVGGTCGQKKALVVLVKVMGRDTKRNIHFNVVTFILGERRRRK